jgi:hypothetical protein
MNCSRGRYQRRDGSPPADRISYSSTWESFKATFITTIKFTEQGVQNFQESLKRAAAFKSAVKKLGVKVTDGNNRCR